MIEWRIEAREFVNCNCAYGCPCQFNALPTNGNCEAVLGIEIDAGHFGEVTLDGLRAAGMYRWPGPIHEGNGTMQLVVDERADESQQDALLRIMQGEETEPMATMWSVYTAMTTTILEPLVRPIEFEVDIEERRARAGGPGYLGNRAASPSATRSPAHPRAHASTSPRASSSPLPKSAAARPGPPRPSPSTCATPTASSPGSTSRTPASSATPPDDDGRFGAVRTRARARPRPRRRRLGRGHRRGVALHARRRRYGRCGGVVALGFSCSRSPCGG